MQARIVRPLAAAAALALGLASASAWAVPSESEVAQARSDCHAQKLRVSSMRERLGPEAYELEPALRRWESSCAMAQSMMDLRAGRPVLRAEAPSGYRQAEFARYEPAAEDRGCE